MDHVTPPTHAYEVPPGTPRSTVFQVRLNGQPAAVAHTDAADFVVACGPGPFAFEIELAEPAARAVVRPLRLGCRAEVRDRVVAVVLPGPQRVSVEVEGRKPLFLFCHAPEQGRPGPHDPGVRFFAAGRTYDAGDIRLESGQTLYLEGGAVVRGAVHAVDARDVRVAGHGVLDGGLFTPAAPRRGITFEHCRDVRVEGIAMVRPSTWMIVLGACDGVVVRDVAQIGEVVCSDGVDVVGSCDVLIEDCFLTNNDDCVVVKSMGGENQANGRERDWRRDVRNVVTRRCTLLCRGAGNAMEIGFELQADSIRDIVFEDLDVIGAHVYAAVFSIHNGDRATVRNVLFRDIRVEHMWNKLVDIRILHSRYSLDAERGQVREVVFRNIRCLPNTFNTPSLIGGYDATHTVEDVRFEDFFVGDRKVMSADDLQLFTRQAHRISFH